MVEWGDDIDPSVRTFLRRLEEADLKRLEYFLRMSDEDFEQFKEWHYWQRGMMTLSKFAKILIIGVLGTIVGVIAFIDNIRKAVGWYQGGH